MISTTYCPITKTRHTAPNRCACTRPMKIHHLGKVLAEAIRKAGVLSTETKRKEVIYAP